jgi:EAL domain-containing protein (putative c-di-GMP-specific phosphodiesterase class I)/DNA-binding response OmpR family regulator
VVEVSAPATILIVDDDPSIRRLFATTLQRAGFSTIEAASAEAGMALLDAHDIALVLSDVGLPVMSGIEFARVVRLRLDGETLPIILITGSGEDATVVSGLDAGADDYIQKPVHVDELVARVRAQLRNQDAWTRAVEEELRVRSGAVAALRAVRLSASPAETAAAVVEELRRRTDFDFVAVSQVLGEALLRELAAYDRFGEGTGREEVMPTGLASYLLDRVRNGPWVDQVRTAVLPQPSAIQAAGRLDLVAHAPIFDGQRVVGLLSIGSAPDPARSMSRRQARLLAAAIDYASVLSAIAGSTISDSLEAEALRARLRDVLRSKAFHPVFQPIVDIETRTVVGYEALTRFDDDTRPDLRFAEAERLGLGPDFELAAVVAATDVASELPDGLYLTINLSPKTVVEHVADLRRIAQSAGRPMVIELTEHVAIDDYQGLRSALVGIGEGVGVAVDDAGAGYASLRHILELRPAFAKMDISLVRGIDGDDLRQALAAGLNYFALRTGCTLIAEGVETEAEAAILGQLGIEYAQGYLYGRPAPIWQAAGLD